MSTTNLDDVKPDETLDVQGEICPYPQIYTRKKLEKMADGRVLEVLTDHPPAGEQTIHGLCQTMHYPYQVKKEGALYKIRIKKSAQG